MIIRQVLGTAALLTMIGMVPPAVEAAVPGPFRFTVVTSSDHPRFIKVVRLRRHNRTILLQRWRGIRM
jgi:hypothetical protein